MQRRLSAFQRLSLLGLASAAALTAASCTTIPEQIQGEYTQLSPARVYDGGFGTEVRWGGVILGSYIEQEQSCFEILSKELDKYLRPKLADDTAGRFLACNKGFYDPEIYAKGREVTLVGTVESMETRKVDEFDYNYPKLSVKTMVLWQQRQDITYYRGYDPYPYYWGYGYGWGYSPYRHPYYRGPHMSSGYAYTRKSLPDPAIMTTRDE